MNDIDHETELLQFWQWALSDLRSNTVRPLLAEYLVGKALGCLDKCRREWTAWDFTYGGWNIEVKSAGYVQSWAAAKSPQIRFGIAPAKNAYDTDQLTMIGPGRHAHLFVFCLHTEMDIERAGTLDLASWEFYILPTSILETAVGPQKSLSLSGVQKLAAPTAWHSLKDEIARAIQSLP